MNSPDEQQRAARPPVASADEDPNVDLTCYASPPCMMHELDPSYFGALSPPEVIGLLAWLLACERDFEAGSASASADERFVPLLEGWLRRHGAPEQPAGGGAPDTTAERTPAAAAARLRDALPRIADEALHRDLQRLLQAHETRGWNR